MSGGRGNSSNSSVSNNSNNNNNNDGGDERLLFLRSVGERNEIGFPLDSSRRITRNRQEDTSQRGS